MTDRVTIIPSESITYAPEGPPTALSMTLRDYFAAKVMQSLMQEHTGGDERYYASCADTSYAMADAMMEARK
jgi:hypothetical protein